MSQVIWDQYQQIRFYQTLSKNLTNTPTAECKMSNVIRYPNFKILEGNENSKDTKNN